MEIKRQTPSAAFALVKFCPLPDEWCETLLSRTARAMGVRRPWINDLERLRPLLPPSLRTLEPGDVRYGTDAIPGWALFGRRAQIRYCPGCIAEQRYVRARWRIAALGVCLRHSLVMKAGLAEPSITTQYKAAGRLLVHSATEQEAWEGAQCPTPLAMLHVTRVWKPFEDAVARDAPGEEVSEVLAWALLVERLVDAVSRAIRGADYPSLATPLHEHRAWWLNKYEIAPTPDQRGVTALLQRLPLPVHRRAALRIMVRLVGDEQRKPTILSRLPLQQLHSQLLATHEAAPVSSCGSLPRAQHPSGYVSYEAAEAAIGCEPGLLQYVIREALMEGVKRIRYGRKTYVFIPDAEVRRFQRYFAQCWPLDEMLTALRLDRRGYWLLRDAGLIRPDEFHRWRRYPRERVSALLARLDSVSRPIEEAAGEPIAILGNWLYVAPRPRALALQVLQEILTGQVQLYRDPGGEGFEAYFVDHAAVARLKWLTGARVSQNMRHGRAPGQLELWA